MHVPLTLKTLATPTYRVLHRLAVLTDLRFHFMALDPVLFPDIPSDIKVHSGFAIEHEDCKSDSHRSRTIDGQVLFDSRNPGTSLPP